MSKFRFYFEQFVINDNMISPDRIKSYMKILHKQLKSLSFMLNWSYEDMIILGYHPVIPYLRTRLKRDYHPQWRPYLDLRTRLKRDYHPQWRPYLMVNAGEDEKSSDELRKQLLTRRQPLSANAPLNEIKPYLKYVSFWVGYLNKNIIQTKNEKPLTNGVGGANVDFKCEKNLILPQNSIKLDPH